MDMLITSMEPLEQNTTMILSGMPLVYIYP